VQLLVKQREVTAGIVGALVVVITVLVTQLTILGFFAACVLGPVAYFGTYLLSRSQGAGVLVGEDRRKSLQECVSLQNELDGTLKSLKTDSGTRDQIEGIASVSQNIISAMKKDPEKLEDVSNFDFNYMQPVTKAVETYARLSQENLPGHDTNSMRARLEGLFPKALSRLKAYEEMMYSGDVQQLEGLVDMLEDSFPGDESTAEKSAKT
jgi:hypothetical protein